MDARPVRPGVLPFEYLSGFFDALQSSPRVTFKSYADLPFDFGRKVGSEEELRELYRDEYAAWRKSSQGSEDIEVILLHDCDSGPAETVFLCEYEAKKKIKSTTSLFVKVLDRAGTEIPYDIDFKSLKKLQGRGICFTYHCNAAEICGYEDNMVAIQCNEDVESLARMGFDIRFFSPHGGRASPDGRNNYSYFYPSLLNRNLIWTHNRFAPSGRRYSDGGFIPRLIKGAQGTDLRSYMIETIAAPQRVFLLLHPQYYFAEEPDASVMASEDAPVWVRGYWTLYERGRSDEYWAPLVGRLNQFATTT